MVKRLKRRATRRERTVQGKARAVTVRCDACGKEFAPAVEHRAQDDGGEWVMYTCPHCGEAYTVAHATARGKAIRERMMVLRAKLIGLKGMVGGDVPLKRRRLLEEYGQLRREIEHEVTA